MSQSRDVVNIVIPLQPRVNSPDWDKVVLLLEGSLESLAGQTDQRFRVILAAHEEPAFGVDFDFEFRFLQASWEVGTEPRDKLKDKRRKKLLLYQDVLEPGGGYTMQLDADDRVSNRLVEHVLGGGSDNGYIVRTGYAYDWANDIIAPIPGAWGNSFDSVCGSCAIIRFDPDDLPRRHDDDPDRVYYQLKRHAEYASVMADAGRPLADVPFPAAVYVLNHDNNLHSTIATDRVTRVPRQIARHEVPLTDELRHEFALAKPERG